MNYEGRTIKTHYGHYKKLGDCPIQVVKYEAVHEILKAIKKNNPCFIIQSDSQVVVNAINGVM